jgi:hypothetical protein
MRQFLVCLSDTRTNILADHGETTADVWCYTIEAEDAHAAVQPAADQWRAAAGERVAASLSVSLVTR